MSFLVQVQLDQLSLPSWLKMESIQFYWLNKVDMLNIHGFGTTIDLHRAQVTGGCHAHNAAVYTAGCDYDYEAWANHTGDDMWKWNHIRNVLMPELLSQLPIRINNDSRVLEAEVREVLNSLGYLYNKDPVLGGTIAGYYEQRLTMKYDKAAGKYLRATTYSEFVKPALATCPNLKVQVYTQATKIEMSKYDESSPWEAKGVHLRDVDSGRTSFVRARKELIVCLGAFDTPILLEHSGIGHVERLRKVGVTPILHAPGVGENLQDHIRVNYVGYPASDKLKNLKQSDFDHNVPTEGFILNGPQTSNRILWTITPDISPWNGEIRFQCPVGMVHPEGYGSIHIDTNNPLDRPLVNANFLSSQRDLDIFINGFRACRKIQDQLVNRGLLNDTMDELFPGRKVQLDQDIETYVKENYEDYFHPHGTCRMGKMNDQSSPITSRLLVKGTSNLRVIDASAIPAAPSGNTNVPTALIALNGARFILQDAEQME
eukprot:gene11543-13475_t